MGTPDLQQQVRDLRADLRSESDTLQGYVMPWLEAINVQVEEVRLEKEELTAQNERIHFLEACVRDIKAGADRVIAVLQDVQRILADREARMGDAVITSARRLQEVEARLDRMERRTPPALGVRRAFLRPVSGSMHRADASDLGRPSPERTNAAGPLPAGQATVAGGATCRNQLG
jgi:hypothetical protein